MKKIFGHWIVQGIVVGVLGNAAYAAISSRFSATTISGLAGYFAVLNTPIPVPAWSVIALFALCIALLYRALRKRSVRRTKQPVAFIPDDVCDLVISAIRFADHALSPHEVTEMSRRLKNTEHIGAEDIRIAFETLSAQGWLTVQGMKYGDFCYSLTQESLTYAIARGMPTQRQAETESRADETGSS